MSDFLDCGVEDRGRGRGAVKSKAVMQKIYKEANPLIGFCGFCDVCHVKSYFWRYDFTQRIYTLDFYIW